MFNKVTLFSRKTSKTCFCNIAAYVRYWVQLHKNQQISRNAGVEWCHICRLDTHFLDRTQSWHDSQETLVPARYQREARVSREDCTLCIALLQHDHRASLWCCSSVIYYATTSADFRRFVLHFPALSYGPTYSSPAFSSPAIWSSIFWSCIFSVTIKSS